MSQPLSVDSKTLDFRRAVLAALDSYPEYEYYLKCEFGYTAGGVACELYRPALKQRTQDRFALSYTTFDDAACIPPKIVCDALGVPHDFFTDKTFADVRLHLRVD